LSETRECIDKWLCESKGEKRAKKLATRKKEDQVLVQGTLSWSSLFVLSFQKEGLKREGGLR
jgi:hypothetical protein